MRSQQEQVFAALGDTTRRQVLEILAQTRTQTPTELAEQLPITRQGISKHLQILEQAGLVASQRVGREIRYSFQPEPLSQPLEWIEAVARQWDQRLQALHRYLLEEESAGE